MLARLLGHESWIRRNMEPWRVEGLRVQGLRVQGFKGFRDLGFLGPKFWIHRNMEPCQGYYRGIEENLGMIEFEWNPLRNIIDYRGKEEDPEVPRVEV